MVTGHEKAGYEYDGKKKLPQVYVKDIIRCQQELIDYVDATSSGEAEEKIGYESSWFKSLLSRRLGVGFSERYTTESYK